MSGWIKFLVGLFTVAVISYVMLFGFGTTVEIPLVTSKTALTGAATPVIPIPTGVIAEATPTVTIQSQNIKVTPTVPPVTESNALMPEAVTDELKALPTSPNTCRVIHDYALVSDMKEVATHEGDNFWLHVEYYLADGQPEYEVLLEGTRYLLSQPLRGHAWEYAGCTREQVMKEINQHVARRLQQGANNAGYVDWPSTGLFIKVK